MRTLKKNSRRRRVRAVASGALLLAACQGDACEALPECPSSVPAGCPEPSSATFVDPLIHLGRARGDTFIEILDVVADHPFIYACTGTQGLTVWDATDDDASPRLVAQKIGPDGVAHGSFPRCQHIALDRERDRLVITSRGDEVQKTPFLWMYDMSDPSRPRAIQGWSTSSSVEGVVLDGERILAATHDDGLAVLRDTGATDFTRVGQFKDADSDAWQPLRVGPDSLVVAEGATGLRTYDVSGDEPQLMATLPLEGSSRDLVLDGERVHVATSSGLAVVDVNDPAAPTLVGEISTLGTSLAVALGPDDTVVVAEWDEIRGYDVSDPGAPVERFSEVVPTDDAFSRVLTLDVDPQRRRVYAGEWTGLHVFEQRSGAVGPEIWTSPGSIQFGEIDKGASEDRVLVVRNRGNEPLTVADVVGLDAVDSDPSCFQVPPGGAAPVEVSVRGSSILESFLKICSDDPDEPEALVPVSANEPGRGVGDQAPTIRLVDLDGVEWTNEDLRGQVAVLAYFATF